MTKLQQMLTSLVAAIPAAYLGYVLVMAMVSYSENLSTVAYIVMGLTLLSSVAAALIPVAVMIGSKSKPAPDKIPPSKKETGSDLESVDDDAEVIGESDDSIDVSEEMAESSEFDLGDSSSDLLADGSDDSLDTSDIEMFDDEDEDEPKPKSKSKKKK